VAIAIPLTLLLFASLAKANHLRHSPALRDFLLESFDQFQLAELALVCLKNETKADVERDVRDLISAAGADATEKARRFVRDQG
jgi:hypothetical protein